jgi:two-component system cell cycle sensor histidine kinase/response regulator CckA
MDVNDMACKRYKYCREELISMNVSQVDSPATSKLAPERTARVVEKGVVAFEAEHIAKDGEIFPVEANASTILLNGETVLISTCRDITERKKAEATIASERERLTVTLRSIGDGVIVTDTKGTVTLLNKVAEELTGWHQDEATGMPLETVFNIINESSREKCENPVEKVIKTGLIVGLANHTALIRKDKSEIIIADSAAPIRDSKSEIIGVVLVFRDITAQYRMEQEMQKMQKLESLGILAGGLAHDFNNLLTSIIGNISLAKMQLGVENKSFQRLSDAEKAAQRATDLTHQLLTFAKGGAPIKKLTSIAEIVREAVGFALSGSNVRCIYNIPVNLWGSEVDKGQMNQVFNNLIINSIHAMPNGGTVKASFENINIGAEEIADLNAGNYIRTTFSDEGTGIHEELLGKIFDPYFSTKKTGSGLGLSTVYSILRRHEGGITVESQLGVGTTFTIYIPAVKDLVSSEREETSAVTRGKGKLLVMDDEELIRKVSGEILTALGYEVHFAHDGTEAIEIYKREKNNGAPFDLVIMDLTIPGGIGGKEAIVKLREFDSNATVIVSSGYSVDPIMADFKKYGFSGVINKPYSANQVSEVISKILRS